MAISAKPKRVCISISVIAGRASLKVAFLRLVSGRSFIRFSSSDIPVSTDNVIPPQFIALQWLISDGQLAISELSQKMSLACSTITDLIDRMEKNNLVVRVKDEQDKRVVRIQVQPIGHDIVQKVLGKRRLYLADTLKDFKEDDKELFMGNLKALYEAME